MIGHDVNLLILMPIAEQRGGAEQLLRMLLSEVNFSARGLRVSVVFLENGPLHTECQEKGIPSTVVPAGRLRDVNRFIPTVRRIAEIAGQMKADLILSWMAKAHVYGAIASQFSGIPSAWYQHGLPRNTTWLNRVVSFLPTACILACSHTVAEVQKQQWPPHRTKVVHPCTDLERFDPGSLPSPEVARQKLGLPERGPLIGMVGRLQRWKGMHTLIEAMPQVLVEHPDAHAVIVGGRHDLEPDYKPKLQHQIESSGLQDNVSLVGFQSDVPLWMQSMDIFVHASDHEPFGIVILEAMALGKPVVAGSKGGATEILTDGETGLLAPYGRAEKLAQQILRYLDDPDLAQEMRRNARRRALDFGPDAYARRFTTTITEVLEAQMDDRQNMLQNPLV